MKKSRLYILGFATLCTLAAVKLAMLILIGVNVVSYLSGHTTEAMPSATLTALLVDFLSNLLMCLLGKCLKLWRRRTFWIVLCSPLMMVAVLFLSFVLLGIGPGGRGELTVSLICWGLMLAYLAVPDLLITLEFLRLRHGWPEQPKEKTAYERILSAKK